MKTLLIAVFIFSIMFIGLAQAAVVYDQNFDALAKGNLVGQDSWTDGGNGTQFDVNDTETFKVKTGWGTRRTARPFPRHLALPCVPPW